MKEIKENWKNSFIEEFGIHFDKSEGELQFALEFISELLEEEKQKWAEEILKEIESVLFEKYLEYDDSQRVMKELKQRIKK